MAATTCYFSYPFSPADSLDGTSFETDFSALPQEQALFDDSDLAKLNDAMYSENDNAMFANPAACQYPFFQPQLQQPWELPTPSPEPESQMSYGSPASELYPSPPSTSPVLGQLLYRAAAVKPRMLQAEEDEEDEEYTLSQDSESDKTLIPPSPPTAAADLAMLLPQHRFRYSSLSDANSATTNTSRCGVKRQRQSAGRQNLAKRQHSSGGERGSEEEQEDQQGEEAAPASDGKGARQPHCLVEQRYRNTLNAEIHRLQMALPHLAEFERAESLKTGRCQPTKATIIASAVQYIKALELECSRLRARKMSRQKTASW